MQFQRANKHINTFGEVWLLHKICIYFQCPNIDFKYTTQFILDQQLQQLSNIKPLLQIEMLIAYKLKIT